MSLFRSCRRQDDLPVSTRRQQAWRAQINRELALEAEAHDPNDWSLALVEIGAELAGVRRVGPEFDPVTRELVAAAQRPAPWFQPGRQDHRVHCGGVDTGNLDRTSEGR